MLKDIRLASIDPAISNSFRERGVGLSVGVLLGALLTKPGFLVGGLVFGIKGCPCAGFAGGTEVGNSRPSRAALAPRGLSASPLD